MEERSSNRDLYKRLIIRFLLGMLYIVIIVFIFPRLFRILHPFIFALIMARILNPLVSKIHKLVWKLDSKSLRARKIITLILNLLIIVVVFSLIFYISYTLIKEIISFSYSIQQNWPNILKKFDSFQDKFAWVANILPEELIEFFYGFRDSMLEFIKNTSKRILSSSISVTAAIITGAGNLFINFLTFFLAMYFLISDYHIINNISERYSHLGTVKTLRILKDSVKEALGGFLKSQLIMALLAFIFMFICLSIYGQSHAFIIAFFLGIIDLIPILGTIAILLPWGVIEYIGGDIRKGVFLIIIGFSFMLFRKITEPKVMGSQTGLHPLLALMSTYVGLKFSGVWGAVLGPLVFMIVLSIIRSGIFDNTLADIGTIYRSLSSKLMINRRKN